MPKVATTAKGLRPYLFHGVNLQHREGEDHATGDCPFCGKEGKFQVNAKGGLFRCWVCGEGTDKGTGNVYTFLRRLWDLSDAATNGATKVLAADRKLLHPETLTYWGVCQSIIDGCWLVPGHGTDGKLNQIYSYRKNAKGGRTLFPTPELHHQLHGMPLFDPKKGTVFVCEGPWDAMALWETLRCAKDAGDGSLAVTGAESGSLLADASVLAVPGCNSFAEAWVPLLAGKGVVLLYDNDHPRQSNGRAVMAGWEGMRRVAGLLAGAAEGKRPASIACIHWGKDGHDPSLPSGHDVRDALSAGPGGHELAARVAALGGLLARVGPVPDAWITSGGRKPAAGSGSNGPDLECLPCTSWKTLVNAWRKPMRWVDGLDMALSVMLASITSTKAVGDQLWVKVVGPPSCGKSVLCEALSVNKKYVLAKSTIRGFHSGYMSDRDGKEDNSLAAIVRDKTLVTKDGDTLLQAPNKEQILSEARDIYDRTSRTHYRNKMSKDYEGLSMTWLLCGTESLRALDTSELGERFLDCVIIDDIDEDEERETALRIAYRSAREMSYVSDGKPESRDGPDMVAAKQLTGGYVGHLRDNAQTLLDAVAVPDAAAVRCVDLGAFVAHMRARPSSKQEEKAQREMCYRLTSQMMRLAKCLAVVLNKRKLDAEVMRRTRKVALDTARGRSLEIARHLFAAGDDGLSLGALAILTGETDEKELSFLRFLKRKGVGIVEAFVKSIHPGIKGHPRWRLTAKMQRLWASVVGEE